MDHILPYINIATAVVTVASLIANVTETKKDDEIVAKINKVIQFLAGNFFTFRK